MLPTFDGFDCLVIVSLYHPVYPNHAKVKAGERAQECQIRILLRQ